MIRLGHALLVPVLMMGFTEAGSLTRPGGETTLIIDMDQGVVVGPPQALDGPQVGAIILIPQSGRFYRVTAPPSVILESLRAAGRPMPDLRAVPPTPPAPPIVVR
jgi:hypothetical protein